MTAFAPAVFTLIRCNSWRYWHSSAGAVGTKRVSEDCYCTQGKSSPSTHQPLLVATNLIFSKGFFCFRNFLEYRRRLFPTCYPPPLYRNISNIPLLSRCRCDGGDCSRILRGLHLHRVSSLSAHQFQLEQVVAQRKVWEHESHRALFGCIQYGGGRVGRLPSTAHCLDTTDAHAEEDWRQCNVCAWPCVSFAQKYILIRQLTAE